MIVDKELYKQFEEDFIATSRLSYEQALAIVEGLWAEGVALGVLPPNDPLDGIETDIRIAHVVNSCSGS